RPRRWAATRPAARRSLCSPPGRRPRRAGHGSSANFLPSPAGGAQASQSSSGRHTPACLTIYGDWRGIRGAALAARRYTAPRHRNDLTMRGLLRIVLITIALAAIAPHAHASTLDDMVAAVVRIKTFINPDGNSVSNLGREREGSGIVIDESGLVLT